MSRRSQKSESQSYSTDASKDEGGGGDVSNRVKNERWLLSPQVVKGELFVVDQREKKMVSVMINESRA